MLRLNGCADDAWRTPPPLATGPLTFAASKHAPQTEATTELRLRNKPVFAYIWREQQFQGTALPTSSPFGVPMRMIRPQPSTAFIKSSSLRKRLPRHMNFARSAGMLKFPASFAMEHWALSSVLESTVEVTDPRYLRRNSTRPSPPPPPAAAELELLLDFPPATARDAILTNNDWMIDWLTPVTD